MGLIEAEDVKKRWQEYTEDLYKRDLHEPDNHHGIIIHREPDILECELKWAPGCITMKKASGGDGIPVELVQILKDDAAKMMHSICQQIWNTRQWPQDWKRSVFIPFPKNAQTTSQLHSSHFPGGSDGKVCLQCGRAGFDPWVGKIPWRRKWQSTPGLLPGKSHGQRSLVVYSP